MAEFGVVDLSARETVTAEADRLVNGDRQEAYGHPYDNFLNIARVFTAVIGVPVTAEQAVLCMVGVKLCREAHKPGRDNRVDIAGYAAVLDLVVQRREELADPA